MISPAAVTVQSQKKILVVLGISCYDKSRLARRYEKYHLKIFKGFSLLEISRQNAISFVTNNMDRVEVLG